MEASKQCSCCKTLKCNLKPSFLIGIAAIFLLVLFLLYPLTIILKEAFFFNNKFTLLFIAEVFKNPFYVEGIINSSIISALTTLIVMSAGIPLAWFGARYNFYGKNILSALILAPLILPPFVGAIGIRQILGHYGMLNTALVKIGLFGWAAAPDWLGTAPFLAISLTEALHLYPLFYLNAIVAFANIDDSLIEAAASTGASRGRIFLKIILPLAMPGIFAGAILVLIWSFTELGTPLIFEFSRVMPVQIFDSLKEIGSSSFPYALVCIMLFLSSLFYLTARYFNGRSYAAASFKSGRANYDDTKAHSLKNFLIAFLFIAVAFLAVIPHISVMLTSISESWYKTVLPSSTTLAYYSEALKSELVVPGIKNSLIFASFAVLLDIIAGLAIAFLLVRKHSFLNNFLDTMVMLPLAIPGIVLAFGYVAMSRPGRFFDFWNVVENPAAFLIIAYAIRRLPYMVRGLVAGFQQIPEALEEAALNAGANRLLTTSRITVPLLFPNLIGGAILVFSFAMLEVSDSLILAQKQAFYPITKALFELFQRLGEGRFVAAALGVWAMFFLFFVLCFTNRLFGKKLGSLYRL
jgi:iron(III) transport system permease protein